VIYLDGNSLGPLARCSRRSLGRMISEEWVSTSSRAGRRRVDDAAAAYRDRIGRLIAAADGTVVWRYAIHQGLSGAGRRARAQSVGRVILSDSGNFLPISNRQRPDESLDRGYELRSWLPRRRSTIDETSRCLS